MRRSSPTGQTRSSWSIATAVWWLCCAVVIGLIGLVEARAADRGDAAAARRAAVSRFWAGIVAVLGLASAVTRSELDADTTDYGRVLEPWIGQLALLLLSLVLLERAFRRDATAYVYAAALGLILALSDFNVTYLSDSTEVAPRHRGRDPARRRARRRSPASPDRSRATGSRPPATAADARRRSRDDAPDPTRRSVGRLAAPIDDLSPAGDSARRGPAPSGRSEPAAGPGQLPLSSSIALSSWASPDLASSPRRVLERSLGGTILPADPTPAGCPARCPASRSDVRRGSATRPSRRAARTRP